MKRALFLLLTLIAAAGAFAEKHPNVARGFEAGKSYAFGDIDTVNLFNGNVTLSIPIGQAFPLSTRLSYRFMLHYNSLVWDIEEAERPVNDPPGAVEVVTVAYPDRRSNAGMGWTFGFGRLYPAYAMSNDDASWLYETPDGSEHKLYGIAPEGWQTKDGTFIRARKVGTRMLVELPDGVVQEFEPSPSGNAAPWRLIEMHDLFPAPASAPDRAEHPYANWVHIVYDTTPDGKLRWTVTDSAKRTHTVTFRRFAYDTIVDADFVERVELDGWSSKTPTYHFAYEEKTTTRHTADTDDPTTSVYSGGLTDRPLVQALQQVKLTDGPVNGTDLGYTFDMVYRWVNAHAQDDSGMLRQITLPTKGTIEWTTGNYRMPVAPDPLRDQPYYAEQVVMGVQNRIVTDPIFHPGQTTPQVSTWSYGQGLSPAYDPPRSYDVPKEASRSVTDPAGNITVYFFCVWTGDPFNGWTRNQYGMAASPIQPEAGTELRRFVTKKEYQGAGTLRRTTYVQLIGDSDYSRVQEQKVVYNDDLIASTPRFVLSVSDPDSFDGYGHYRRTTISSNFSGSGDRETYTNYTPQTTPWLLNLYTEQKTTEHPDPAVSGATASVNRRLFHFYTATGFLEWTRTLAGTTEGTTDIREVFTPDDSGNVKQHEIYGGDGGGADATTPRYRLVHTYRAGVLATSRYQDPATGQNVGFLSADVDVDTGTSLVNFSRDTAGQSTGFTYDTAGRLKTITPPGAGANVVSVDYTNAVRSGTFFTPAKIHVSSGEIRREQQFDGLGRLWREKSRMPNGLTWSLRETLRDKTGRTTFVSEPEPIPDLNDELAFHPARWTEYRDFDAFGRPAKIIKPDQRTVSVSYVGDRLTSTTTSVMTELGEIPTTVREERDGLGRLYQVRENSGSPSQWLQSTYRYDVGNRLIAVSTIDAANQEQPREFKYDGRGFLTEEKHPESGKTSYTYDARGHVVTRTTPVAQLAFEYDAAERLKLVKEGGLPLKEFAHDRPNVPGSDYGMGKLDYAIRHNRVLGKDTQVKETYLYGGRGGALSARRTSVSTDGMVENTFEEKYTYDPDGAVQTITYPTCTACQQATPSLTVLNTYKGGLLREVGKVGAPSAYAGAIEYHAGGMWTSIQHTNVDGRPGPLATQTPDPAHPVRPKSIEVSNFCSGFSISSHPTSVSIAFGGTTPLSAGANGATSWKWFANGQEVQDSDSSSISVTPTVTTTYFARASNGTCTVDSARAVVTVGPNCSTADSAVTIKTQPQPVTTVAIGSTVPLSIVAVSAVPVTYQWFEGIGPAAVAVSKADKETFITPPLNRSTTFWVRVSNACGSVDSAPAVITVDPCTFRLQGKGPGEGEFKEASRVDASDYIVALGAHGLVLEVDAQLIAGQAPLDYQYSWSDDPAAHGPIYTVAGPITSPRTITATVTGTRAGFSCTRTVSFRLTPCDSPLAVQAGSCLVSNKPEAYVRLGTTIPLRSDVMKAAAPRELTAEELSQVRFTWTDASGAVIFDGYGAAGALQSYRVPGTAAAVPDYLELAVTGLGCTRTIRMPLVVLNDSPCQEGSDPGGCNSSCLIGLVRVNDVARQTYAFSGHEQVVLTPPATLPVTTTRYEWHRVMNGIDEIVGNMLSLPTTLIAPARFYLRGQAGAVWYTSATLTASLMASSAGVTVTPPSQDVRSGGTVAITVNTTGATPMEYEWRTGNQYDLSTPVIGNGRTLEIAVRHDAVFWCRVKQNGTWLFSPIAEVVTTCTPSVGGLAIPHPPYVARDGFTLIGSAPHGKIQALYWYERNADGSKTILSSGFSSAINFYPRKAITTIGADLVDSCGTTGSLTETQVYLCVPTIEQHPMSTVIAGGTTATLHAAATPAVDGQNVTTTWYEAADVNRTTPVGIGLSFTTPALAAGTLKSYVAEFQSDCASGVQSSVRSAPAVVEACTAPVLVDHTAIRWSTIPGSQVELSVFAEGTDLTYQWYEGGAGDTSRPLPDKTERQFMVYPRTTTDYWCRIKAQGVCVTDTPVTTVRVCSPPAIDVQPRSVRAFANVSVALSVTADASGNTEPLSYQWQQQLGGVWTDVGGATDRAFTTTAVGGTTATYRVIVSAGTCSTASAEATVALCSYPEVVPAAQAETRVKYDATTTLLLPVMTPVQEKAITWYRGATGDRSQPMRSGVGTNFGNDTGLITGTSQFWAEFTNQGCLSRTETYTVRACVPEITKQAGDVIVPPGTATTLTIVATPIVGQIYQWYVGTSGETANPVTNNGTSPSLGVAPEATTTYWCRVTTPCSLTEDSRAATIRTCASPHIDSITQSQSVAAGMSIPLSVSASGTDLTYQWYRGNPGDVTNPVESGAVVSQTVNVATTYWCRVKSEGVCTTDSAAVVINICAPPSISAQPVSQPLFPGKSATLSVVASPAAVSYQWYMGTSGTTTSPIDKATESSITVQPSATTGYWARISSGGCSIDSNTATITACVLPQEVTASPALTEVASGARVTLALPPMTPEVDKNVTWYRGAPGEKTTLITGGPNATYISAHVQSAQYWAEFTHNGCTSRTTAYTISVCKPTISAEPQSMTINGGQPAPLSVTATGDGLTYQWYVGTRGNTASPISGATERTYDPTPSATTSYWVRVKGCTVMDSATATVTICQPPKIEVPPKNVIATASGAPLSVTASGTELTYQWYEGSTAIAATTASINVTPAATTFYRVRVSGRCPPVAESAEVMVSVAPGIDLHPASAAVTSGSTSLLKISASGTLLSYQWYERAGSTITPLKGAIGTSYTTPEITTERRFFCRVTSGEATRDSNDAVLTVCPPASIALSSSPTEVSGALFVYNIVSPVSGATYQWYQGATGQTNIYLGAGTSLSVRPITTTQYWVRTKRAACDADSPAVTAKICVPSINTQPQSDYVVSGTQKTLSVYATGTQPLAYQWYRGAAGDTSTPVGQQSSYTYTATTTASYWVRITGPSAGCTTNTRDSEVATVTVCELRITQQPQSNNYPKNSMFELSVTAEGQNLQYQWYRGNKGDTSTPIGTNSCSLVQYATSTQSYWVRVTGGCAPIDSETAVASVWPVISQQPVNASICALGDPASFSVAATGADSYTWYREVNGGAPQVVGNAATLSIAVDAVPAKFYAYAVSGNARTPSNNVYATVAGVPALTSFTAPQYSPPSYTLTAVVAASDSSLVGYRFYQGARGNTTTLLADSTTNYKTVTPPTLPMQYWVRVYYRSNPTRCFAEAGLSVP